jgi:hypothetical protein
MLSGQITTFSELAVAWREAERESDRRAVWRMLARGGWFRACKEAVQVGDQATLEIWLDEGDRTKQDIIQFNGADLAQMVHLYLLCSLVACRIRSLASLDRGKALQETVAAASASLGFCHDLTLALMGEPLCRAQKDVSMSVLLVETTRNEGVVATLMLELIPDGKGDFYPVPELSFLRDPDFRQTEDNARECLQRMELWKREWNVRWRLQRHDDKPVVNLTGPSLGAAFALGLGKLFAEL